MDVHFADGQQEQYEDTESFFGSEGMLYRSKNGQNLVKLFPHDRLPLQERVKRIDTLIHELNPTKDDAYWSTFFSWPEKRVTSPTVGFRMPFRDGMRTIEHYFLPKSFARLPLEDRGWFIGRVASAIKLVTAARRLATMGLCYPDFSGKNVLVDPFAGLAVLIDCDSLTVPGKLSATVDGSPEFQAPELVAHEITLPSVETDRHALAVLLYRWLLYWHPLVGDFHYATDPDEDELLRFGKMATYIEHPTETKNRASKQVLKASALGPEMAQLFQRAFVDGLHNPRRRPQPFEWQQALYHIYDQLIPCSASTCLWHFFVPRPNEALICPACQEPLKQPDELPFLFLLQHSGRSDPTDYLQNEARAHYLVGWPGRKLYQWHIRPDAAPMYTSPTNMPDIQPWGSFEMDQQTNDWYLRNLSKQAMYYQLPGESSQQWYLWQPGSDILLLPNMYLQFGPAPWHFRASIRFMHVGK